MIYRLAKKKNLKAEINVVPYIDVMLVLLIIFMILSPLLIQGIEVNLPKTDTTKISESLLCQTFWHLATIVNTIATLLLKGTIFLFSDEKRFKRVSV